MCLSIKELNFTDVTDNKAIEELLSKVMSGIRLTDNEIVTLETWASLNDENNRMLDNLLLALSDAQTADRSRVADLYPAVMAKTGNVRRLKRMRLALSGAGVAVSCIVAALLLWPVTRELPVAGHAPDAIILSDDTGRAVDIESAVASHAAKVDMQTRSADFSSRQTEAAKPELQPKLYSIQVPFAKEINVVLPDGSKVWVNAGSRISFPEFFAGDTREVQLEGEAFFDVAHDESKPFIVKTGRMTTQVYGTRFLVSAYSDAASSRVSLVEGSVGITAGSKQAMLQPGQGIEYNSAEEQLSHFAVNIKEVNSYMQPLFVFEDVDLGTIAKRLERWYGVKLGFEDPQLAALHFFVKVDKYEHITSVMELLKATNRIDYEYDGNNILFKRPAGHR